MSEPRWWVFRRPLLRDWLFILGLVLGGVLSVRSVLQEEDLSIIAVALWLVLGVSSGLLAVGVIGGSVREYRRGRNGLA